MPNTPITCLGCSEVIPLGSGRLCPECLSAVWDNDGDRWTFVDTHTNMLREVAKEDQERRHAITQERTA